MGEVFRRPYQPADASALAGLLNLLDEHAGADAGYTPDEVRSYLAGVVKDVGANTRLVFAADDGLVAAAVTAPPPTGGYRVDLDGGVHPAWRGRGLGRELLGAQLARAAELRRHRASAGAWEVHSSAMVADEDSLRLFRRFGMAPVRYWFDMVAPTARPPALSPPQGLRVVTYASDHETALHAAHSEAFADHWGYQPRDLETWTAVSTRSGGFLPSLSLLAFDGEAIAGYLLSYKNADPDRLYIGQVGVLRPWRRRGLAGALLSAVLTAAGQAGLTSAALGVDADSPTGAVGVYERVGFAAQHRAVTYALPLTD